MNTRSIYKISHLNFSERNLISFYLPKLNVFGTDLKKIISFEQDKFFSLKCYRRNRLLLGYLRMAKELIVTQKQQKTTN